MKISLKSLIVSFVIGCGLLGLPALNAMDMQERIRSATQILQDRQNSSHPIPNAVRARAKAVAIFDVTKGGLGIGGSGGEGVVFLRDKGTLSRGWSAPSAFNVGGVSIGAQIGFTQSRYIVFLNTDEAVRQFISTGKTTFDATATGTAGSESVTERTTSSELERLDVVVYKDTDGVFGGATLGGTSVERKDEINRQAYGQNVLLDDILQGKVPTPVSALRLIGLLDARL